MATIKDYAEVAAEQGYGRKEGDSYDELGHDVVIVGNAVAPRWLAEVLGRVGIKNREEEGK
jgi:hypothetical protein